MRRLSFNQSFLFVISFFCKLSLSASSSSKQNQLRLCSNSVIQVKNITLLCDSPGSYYYGSGKYRNSVTCVPGDKARLSVEFYIAPSLASNSDYGGGNNNVLLTIVAQGGSYSELSYNVYWNAPLCSISSLVQVDSYKSGCPSVGSYQISSSFYWDDSDVNDESAFVPTIAVGFRSSKSQQYFNLGGANTELCSGKSGTSVSWTKYVQPTSADEKSSFYWSLGILAGAIAIGGAFVIFLRRRQCNQCCFSEEDPFLEVIDDTKKMQMFRSNRMLVDF